MFPFGRLKQLAIEKPIADAYAAELSLIGSEEPAYLSIRVEVLNVALSLIPILSANFVTENSLLKKLF